MPADARAKITKPCPSWNPGLLAGGDAQMENDFRDPGLNDYRAGSFLLGYPPRRPV